MHYFQVSFRPKSSALHSRELQAHNSINISNSNVNSAIIVIVIVIITLPLGLSAFEQRGCESSHSKYSLGLNPLKTTMTFRPECHGFHKSDFVMVIKGYDSITPLVLRFDAAGGFHIKFQATTYHPPPSPLISFSPSCSLKSSHSTKSNLLHFHRRR